MNYKTILLLVLTATMLFGQGRRGDRMMTWDENLNLTTEQMQQITELREAMQPGMQTMRQNTRTLERELRDLVRNGGTDEARIAELEAAIAANQTAIDALMTSHRADIRALLTEDQQVIFDAREFGPREQRRGSRGDRGSDDNRGRRGSRPGNRRP